MNILTCILSYNRGEYLRNTVDSFFECFRYGDLVVLDDFSPDEKTQQVLVKLALRGISVLCPHKNRDKMGMHGGLYDNMDYGLQLAVDGGYEYVQFIQDDMQFVWFNSNIKSQIDCIYSLLPNTSMVENTFWGKSAEPYLASKLELYPDAKCSNRVKRGMIDVGIWKTQVLLNTRFSFGNGTEKTNSLWWRRQGFRSYRLHSPSLCFVPEAPVYRNRTRLYLVDVVKPKRLLIEPLSSEAILRLCSAGINKFAFDEDYCKPWGWECETPYQLGAGKVSEVMLRKKKYIFLIYISKRFFPKRLRDFLVFILSQ